MQFKMAENSLFAVLLRSSWWISLSVALVMIGLVGMAFGSEYIVFGIAGALPFLVISAMAGYRQWQAPSAKQIEATVEGLRAIPVREVNARLSTAWEAEGFEAQPFTKDGADLELTKSWRVVLVCTRRYKAANNGIETLKALKQAGQQREATALIYVALGSLSDAASRYAKDNNIEVMDADGLARLLG